ncbi:MAG: sigma-70 family RNA polymerase sigma factor [Deltaproteobacteria bacterium]|nr:sigma-70 family RNA polymerase sigma factor [Deltaproteobacteria bacterium]
MNSKTAQSEPKINFRRLQQRDKEEVVRWFDNYADPVYGFIFYRVNRDADMAGEVAQETFLTALETIDRFDPAKGKMFPWLTYIARNCIRKALRRRKKNHTQAELWEALDQKLRETITDMNSNIIPEELLQQKETAELVRIVLTNLPLRYQVALQRRYFEDLSLHEMAVLEKSSEGAMKVMLHRARQAFREAFETISTSFLERKNEGRIIP